MMESLSWGTWQRSPTRRASKFDRNAHPCDRFDSPELGRDTAGRTIIQVAVDDWVLEMLLTFEADAADLEDGGDDEPDADDEEDGLPVMVELVRPKAIGCGRLASRPLFAPALP